MLNRQVQFLPTADQWRSLRRSTFITLLITFHMQEKHHSGFKVLKTNLCSRSVRSLKNHDGMHDELTSLRLVSGLFLKD